MLALPQGKDPDELIRADVRSVAQGRRDRQAGGRPPDRRDQRRPGPDGASRPLRRWSRTCCPPIGEVSDPVLQAHYLQRLSRLARVSEDALRRQMPRRARPAPRAARRRRRAVCVRERRAGRATCKPLRSAAGGVRAGDAVPAAGDGSARLRSVSDELFSLSENRELFRRWRAGEAVTEDESELCEHSAERFRRLVCQCKKRDRPRRRS